MASVTKAQAASVQAGAYRYGEHAAKTPHRLSFAQALNFGMVTSDTSASTTTAYYRGHRLIQFALKFYF
jgi:hypothetical protein